jgi:hypothetical protein
LNFMGFLMALAHVAALKYLPDLPLGSDLPLSTSFQKLLNLHFDLYVYPDIAKKVSHTRCSWNDSILHFAHCIFVSCRHQNGLKQSAVLLTIVCFRGHSL